MKRMLLLVVGVCFFGAAVAQVKTPVNINRADVKQLLTLKGIGPKKAEAIVASRKRAGAFRSIDSLTRIKGIGKSFLQRLLKRNPGKIVLKRGRG